LFWDAPDVQGFKVNELPGSATGVQDPEHPHGWNCLQDLSSVVASPFVPRFNHVSCGEISQIVHSANRWFVRHDPLLLIVQAGPLSRDLEFGPNFAPMFLNDDECRA
jgi:hypothetical protein